MDATPNEVPALPAPATFDVLSDTQLAIYARELSDFYRKTQDLRARLDEREQMIEQRSCEVTALNRLLQEHIREWAELAECYRAIVREMKRALEAGGMPNAKTLAHLLDGVGLTPRDDDSPAGDKPEADGPASI